MHTSNARRANRLFSLDVAAVLVALVAFAGTAHAQDVPADDATVAKRSFSVAGFKNGTVVGAAKTSRNSPATKARTQVARNVDSGFYVYDAFAEIFFDEDGDGFYYGLDVFFDVDTDFAAANVYAALYLSRNGGPWELYFETADFTINGAVADDEFVVETELFEGYATDYYDVLVEIYDADFGDFVAEFGPADTSSLSVLPLEDQLKDTPVFVGNGFVQVSGGGGALGGTLLIMGLLAARRFIK